MGASLPVVRDELPNNDNPGDLEDAKVEAPSTDTVNDEFSVTWDEPADKDPENPMNWSSAKKWMIIATLSFQSFIV